MRRALMVCPTCGDWWMSRRYHGTAYDVGDRSTAACDGRFSEAPIHANETYICISVDDGADVIAKRLECGEPVPTEELALAKLLISNSQE